MIIIAITIYVLMNLTPKWILKKKYKKLEDNFNWKIPLMKLSGLGLSFCLAFLLIFGTTKSTKDKFVENGNAIYGFKFNNVMKEFGFQDSMRIMSINGENIGRVSDIVKKILMESGEIEVNVEKNGIHQVIVIKEKDKLTLMRSSNLYLLEPIIQGPKGESNIKVTTENYGFSDVLNGFGTLWKQAMIFINPNSSAKHELGGFVTISEINNFRGYLMLLSFNLIILGILNMLPLPGFSFGNLIISTIETLRKKLYDQKKKSVIGLISIFIVLVLIGIRIYM